MCQNDDKSSVFEGLFTDLNISHEQISELLDMIDEINEFCSKYKDTGWSWKIKEIMIKHLKVMPRFPKE